EMARRIQKDGIGLERRPRRARAEAVRRQYLQFAFDPLRAPATQGRDGLEGRAVVEGGVSFLTGAGIAVEHLPRVVRRPLAGQAPRRARLNRPSRLRQDALPLDCEKLAALPVVFANPEDTGTYLRALAVRTRADDIRRDADGDVALIDRQPAIGANLVDANDA